jgi:hypothetical protein
VIPPRTRTGWCDDEEDITVGPALGTQQVKMSVRQMTWGDEKLKERLRG